MRKKLLLPLIIGLLFLGASFYWWNLGQKKNPQRANPQLTLALLGDQTEGLIFTLAEKTQVFQSYPSEFNWRRLSSVQEGIENLSDQSLDLLILSPESLLALESIPDDLIIIGQLGANRIFHLMSLEEDPDFDLQKLKGQNILTMPENTVEIAFLKDFLVKADLIPYRNINFTTNLPPKGALALFRVSKTYYLQASEALAQRLMVKKEGFSVQEITYPFPPLILVVNQNTLLSKEQELGHLLQGLSLSQLMVKHHPTKDLTEILQSSTISKGEIIAFKRSMGDAPLKVSDKDLNLILKVLRDVHFINPDKKLPKVDSTLVEKVPPVTLPPKEE